MTTYDLFNEILLKYSLKDIAEYLYLHIGTLKRWIGNKDVPEDYFNDLNSMIGNKYPLKLSKSFQDQYFTKPEIAEHCLNILKRELEKLDLNINEYTFIEPSAGNGAFYNILPQPKIGIDLCPPEKYINEYISQNYLMYEPQNNKYIVIGNPPFGLRGNLALRFINHSYNFADIVAFILPPLFNSTGKGVPMKRINGYKLVYSELLPENSFVYPDGTPVVVQTIFQIWSKVNTDKITYSAFNIDSCKGYIKIYSMSDGGKPSSTRNKDMIGKCDIYLPSTCFSGMKCYTNFEDLPNRRGYGIVILQEKERILQLFNSTDWLEKAFNSTNGAKNLRMDIIEKVVTDEGFIDQLL